MSRSDQAFIKVFSHRGLASSRLAMKNDLLPDRYQGRRASVVPRPHFARYAPWNRGEEKDSRTAPAFPIFGAVAGQSKISTSDGLHQVSKRSFEPVFSVDRFVWSPLCDALATQRATCIDQMIGEWRAAAQHGSCVVAITSCQRGHGSTTILMCLARRLTTFGLHAALVDADFSKPTLGERLGLTLSQGWENVLKGQVSLSEVVVLSRHDELTLLPLHRSVSFPEDSLARDCMVKNIELLRENFPLVILDMGPVLDQENCSVPWSLAGHVKPDVTVLVSDVRQDQKADLTVARGELATMGVAHVGVVENFNETSCGK